MTFEQLIFKVLPDETIHFRLLHNSSRILASQIRPSLDSQSTLQALKYRTPIPFLSPQTNLTILCIPAQEHTIIHQLNPSSTLESSSDNIPHLIKTPKEGDFQGYLSGHRSGILVHNNRLLRYKGCGNDDQGIILQNNEVSGCHFAHTAKRELYITTQINSILRETLNISSANLSICFYELTAELVLHGLRNDIPLLPKYCCVFQTLGDRRIGTHLISPLEILFLNLFPLEQSPWEEMFTKNKRIDEQNDLIELVVDFELTVSTGETFLDRYLQSQQCKNYVDLEYLDCKQIKGFANVPQLHQLLQTIGENYLKNGESLLRFFDPHVNWLQIITIVLLKIGYEMGEIKRIFCQKHLNWGFFNDHGFWHCNAHLNNFIVTKPSLGQFVYPLDFDIAFFRDEFINIDLSMATYGQKDDDCFENLLLAEYNAMEMSVSGLQIMNFKYSIEGVSATPTRIESMARISFRDTLIKSFRAGMRNNQHEKQRINTLWQTHLPQLTNLIEACLLISSKFNT